MLLISGPGGTSSDYELVTLSAFKAFAGISTGADDTLLGVLVDGVNRSAYRELGDRFLKSTGTQYDMLVDVTYPDKLYLPHYPVVSIAQIDLIMRTGNDTFSVMRTYTSSEYQLNKASGLLTPVYFTWPYGRENLRVQFQAGYAAVPSDIAEALSAWIMVKYQRVKGKRLDVISASNDTESLTFTFDDMPPATRRTLDGYRYVEAFLV